jgi:hypothetical protein
MSVDGLGSPLLLGLKLECLSRMLSFLDGVPFIEKFLLEGSDAAVFDPEGLGGALMNIPLGAL